MRRKIYSNEITGHVAVQNAAAGRTDASVRAPLSASARPAGVVRGGINGARAPLQVRCLREKFLQSLPGTLDSFPHLPADADTALINRSAFIVSVIVIVPLWPHFRYVARLETFEQLEAASALALRYGQLSGRC